MYRNVGGACLAIMVPALFMFAGPAAAETVVRPQLTVEEKYDSNPAFGSGASSDFATTLSPSVSVAAGSRESTFKGTYELNSVFYHKESGLDYTAQSADLEAAFTPSKGAKAVFRDTVAKTMDSLVALDAGIQTERAWILSNTAAIEFQKEITQRGALELALEDERMDFDSPSFVDTRSYGASVAWRYAYSDLAALKTGYAYARYHFETDGADDVNVHKAAVELTKRFSEGLSATLSAGFVLADGNGDGTHPDWTVDASATKGFKGGTLSAGVSRDISHSSGLSGEISVTNRLYLRAAKGLGESSGLSLSFSLADSGSEPSGELDVTSYGAELASYWQPRQWVRLSGGYSRFQQWADGAVAGDLDRDQVFIKVTLMPLDWRI
ncbi:MAG: hypothetical protein HYV24_11980 [Deltaproteobacteria bacterium]|nr:hypothetical protein [Deltaproteobacteria bacterium]